MHDGIRRKQDLVAEDDRCLMMTSFLVVLNGGGGSVILNSMSIIGGSLKYLSNNTPCRDIGNGGIRCSSVIFVNITRMIGNGRRFEFTSMSTSITLSNMIVTEWRCIDGYGEVVYE